MSGRSDPIAVVEACYDLGATEDRWMQGIADTLHGLIGKPRHGTIAYHVEVASGGLRITDAVQSGGETDVASRIRSMGDLLERRRTGNARLVDRVQAKVYTAVVQGGLRSPVDRLLMSEFDKLGPDWMYTLGVPGVRDHFLLVNHHIDGLGATIVASGLSRKVLITPAERAMYQMVSAHIKSGLRLRRRLAEMQTAIEAPEGGAVLDSEGSVVHADGDARDDDALEGLRRMVKCIDQARTTRTGRDEEALALWEGLVQGRWSVVDRFDSDGRRYLLAYRNPENVTDPRGLSDMQIRVTGLAVRGYSNKLIAYHLGIAEGTASFHLHHAMRKLGIADRVELVRVLGTHFPQPTDPRFPN